MTGAIKSLDISPPGSRIRILVFWACVLVGFAVLWQKCLPIGPAPTDDIFYFDAAAKLCRGTYQAPGPFFPIHHYLRWPVILPLAALFCALGITPSAVAAYSVLHFLGVMLATYYLAYKVTENRGVAAAASLAAALLPHAEMLPFLIRSEPPALLWTLVSACVAIGSGTPFLQRNRLFAAGCFMALAVDATHVAIFSAPLVIALAFHVFQSRLGPSPCRTSWQLLRACIFYALGLLAATLIILSAEGLATKDPLIQYHVITQSLAGAPHNPSLQSYLGPADNPRFILGFTRGLLKQAPFFLSTTILVFVWRTLFTSPASRKCKSFLFAATIGFIALEVCGSFVLLKTFLRYTCIPIYFVSVYLMAEAAGSLSSWRNGVMALGGGVAIVLAVLNCVRLDLADRLRSDPWIRYYRDPIELVKVEASRLQISPARVKIVVRPDGVSGLIPWPLAVPAYSYFVFDSSSLVLAQTSTVPLSEDLNFFLVDTPELAASVPQQAKEIQYPTAYDSPRPRVFELLPRTIQPKD